MDVFVYIDQLGNDLQNNTFVKSIAVEDSRLMLGAG
jgi:hypothetical protein